MVETAPREEALRLDKVSKSFGALKALNEVSFAVERGEILTMLGPSGSGKTTTLRIIAGFMRPDSGDLTIGSRSVVNVAANKRNIGMVFQDYALFPHMSVVDNIAFPLESRGVGREERVRRAHDMLSVIGLDGYAGRLPKQLSGGQQQRVALARALVFQPEIVLLDEPLGALDKNLRGAMQLEILRLARLFGATVILVTHDQEEALVMSDRIALFSAGAIEQIGTPRQLYERPATEFAARFIGDSNVLKGDVVRDGDAVLLRGSGWAATLRNASENARLQKTASIALRPENITVRSLGNRTSEPIPRDGCFGKVQSVVYLGATTRIVVALAGGDTISAVIPSSSSSCRVDDDVELSWKPDDCVALVS